MSAGEIRLLIIAEKTAGPRVLRFMIGPGDESEFWRWVAQYT
jgi:hypothetical protein